MTAAPVSFYVLLGTLVAQRISELVIAARNTRWIRERGGYEVGREHYRWAIIMHTAFLAAFTLEVHLRGLRPPSWWWFPFTMFVVAQGLRYWAIGSLGRFWNTRIFVLPGADIVQEGAYRYFRHPNYIAIRIELVAIPLIFQAWYTAVLFPLLNAWFLAVRIPAEERALLKAAAENMDEGEPERES